MSSNTRFVASNLPQYEMISDGAKVTRYNPAVNLGYVENYIKLDGIEYDTDSRNVRITGSERYCIVFVYNHGSVRWVFPSRNLRDFNYDKLEFSSLSTRIEKQKSDD